jgi:hypothetical protein
MAWSQSFALAGLTGLSLALAALSPLLWWHSKLKWPATALGTYFAASALAPFFGAYPVPLAGYGLSFVIGWQLGFAALAASKSQLDLGHSLRRT